MPHATRDCYHLSRQKVNLALLELNDEASFYGQECLIRVGLAIVGSSGIMKSPREPPTQSRNGFHAFLASPLLKPLQTILMLRTLWRLIDIVSPQ